MTWFQAPGATLPNLIALHGKWRGARTALIEGERRLTWRQFERETARVANGLGSRGRAHGQQPGDGRPVVRHSAIWRRGGAVECFRQRQRGGADDRGRRRA